MTSEIIPPTRVASVVALGAVAGNLTGAGIIACRLVARQRHGYTRCSRSAAAPIWWRGRLSSCFSPRLQAAS